MNKVHEAQAVFAFVAILGAFFIVQLIAGSFPAIGWRETLVIGLPSFVAIMLLQGSLNERIREGVWVTKPVASTSSQFGLRDVMLVVVWIAAAATMARTALQAAPILYWRGFFAAVAITIGATCLVAIAVTVKRRLWKLFAFVATLGVLVIASPWRESLGFWCTTLFVQLPQTGITAKAIGAVVATHYLTYLLICVYVISMAGWIRLHETNRETPTRTERIAKYGSVGIMLTFAVCLIPVFGSMVVPQGELPAVYGDANPDAYNRLVDAAKNLQTLKTANQIQKQYEITNTISREPLSASADVADLSRTRLSDVRALARGLMNESSKAAKRKDFDKVIWYSSQNLRVGSGVARGGLLTDTLTGIAIESLGNSSIISNLADFSPQQCQRLLQELANFDDRRESIESVRRREKLEFERHYGWRHRLSQSAPTLSAQPSDQWQFQYSPTLEATIGAIQRRDTIHRLLIAELAIRVFVDKHARHPQSLEQLVPEFIAAVPIDPYSEMPLVYRTDGDEYAVYSVGPFRHDDGGRFGNEGESFHTDGFDVDLQSIVRP